MAASFDIESTVDFQEVRNAVQQAAKEIASRYDLKKAGSRLELDGQVLVLESSEEFTLEQAAEVMKTRLVRRGVDLKSLRPDAVQPASGGRVRQRIEIQQGIPTDTCRKIVASIKKLKLKVQSSIQGDSVRVSGKKRDDLQTVIEHLKELDLDVPLRFTNYR